MKLSNKKLKQIIKEELQRLTPINELTPVDMGFAAAKMDDDEREAKENMYGFWSKT